MPTKLSYLAQLAFAAAALLSVHAVRATPPATDAHPTRQADLAYLHAVAVKVLDSAIVAPRAQILGAAKNTTGHTLRVPGGTQSYYPAFWIRDAAMMLDGDFIPATEIEGWVRVIAATQPGPNGLHFGRLFVPPYSIPDHIAMSGEACWYPGAYAEQGNGSFGFLPPADNPYFFVHMVHEQWRLSRSLNFFHTELKTSWGQHRLSEICLKAFAAVAVDKRTGLVCCEPTERRTRVDWGFSDSIGKTGLCLVPSLLRWRAACELADLLKADDQKKEASRLRSEAKKIQAAIVSTFYQDLPAHALSKTGCLLSATELGRKDDIWGSAFAIWLGVLPSEIETRISRHLLALYNEGSIVVEGQVRHLPLTGAFGGGWEKSLCAPGQYQNGGYWATPVGWLVIALQRIDPTAADRLFSEYITHLRANEQKGAPWEWINPALNLRVNPRYASSVGLVYTAISSDGFHPRKK